MLEFIIFILFIISLILSFVMIKNNRGAVFNVVFLSFAIGIFLTALSRLFLFLGDNGFYKLEDVTMHIWWHLIFFMGLFAFIWGGIKMKKNATAQTPTGIEKNDIIFLSFLCILSLAIFGIAPYVEPTMAKLFVGSIVDTMGLHHLIAALLAMIAAVFLFYIKKDWGKLLSVGVIPLIIFLFLMAVQHVWEILTESWKVIHVLPETGEMVERFIVIPAIIFFVLGMYRIYRSLKNSYSSDKKE